MRKIIFTFILVPFVLACGINKGYGENNKYYVDNKKENGSGTLNNPFNNFNSAMKVLKPGDTVYIMPGIYNISKAIKPVNSGKHNKWITIKAFEPDKRPIIKPRSIRAILIQNIRFYKFENIEIDGGFIKDQLIIMRGGNSNIEFYNCKIGRSSTDGIAISESDNVVFDHCEIYNCIRYENGIRKDAHGIMYNSGTKLTVKNCNIYHNTGDCIQVGTKLSFPTWDSLFVTNCHLWGGVVDSVINGIPPGFCIGENAIDTKTPDSIAIDSIQPGYRGYVYLEKVIAHGFYGKYDWPAFAINMTVNATLKNCVAFDNAIGYRLMGTYKQPKMKNGVRGAWVKMINCIAYDNYWAALWPENDIDSVKIWNCTFDKPDTIVWFNRNAKYFDGRTKFNKGGWDVRNTIFVGNIKSYDFFVKSNIYIATSHDFVDYKKHDYRLVKSSGAINKGVNISEVKKDIEGNPRIINEYDIGAYEFRDVK